MTCEHVPTHPMAPATRCCKCMAVIRRSLCPACNGSGEQYEGECDACRGTGKGAWVCVKAQEKKP